LMLSVVMALISQATKLSPLATESVCIDDTLS